MGSFRESELRALGAEVAPLLAIDEAVRVAVAAWARAHGLSGRALRALRLFASTPRGLTGAECAGRARRSSATRLRACGAASVASQDAAVERVSAVFSGSVEPEAVGALYEALLDATSNRKKSGSFFTPRPIAEKVARAALQGLPPEEIVVCDPSLGGGAFLLAVARRLVELWGDSPRVRRCVAERCLTGVDVSELAVAVTEAVIWLWVADATLDPAPLRRRLLVRDALERGWEAELLGARTGFDLVVGNPPWIAYAGRAAQPLARDVRRRLAEQYTSFRGYPTLHGLFVERSAELAKGGVVALVLPSPLSDLDGYRPVRAALARSHVPREPLLELGQDAFFGVTQPSFVLIADSGGGSASARPWKLVERQRALAQASEVCVPDVLERVALGPSLPAELFREMGFQSAGDVAKTLFSRSDVPDAEHDVPLLEGREVREFAAGRPRLFMRPDPEVLARARCRLRPAEHYRSVAFVVRQTAKYPIAALHHGSPFRNTLLAGLHHPELSPELVVALLNSTLYRAIHLALRRDARQAVFPQVKIRHLRALPRPPEDRGVFGELERITRSATNGGPKSELRRELDRHVFRLFGVSTEERDAIERFISTRAPELLAGANAMRKPKRPDRPSSVAQ